MSEKYFHPFSDQQNWSNFKAEVERLTRHVDEHMGLQRIEISHDVLERIVRESSEKDAVIERLRELVEAGKKDCKALDELVDENLRLRGLLSKSREYVDNVVLADELDEELYKDLPDA